MNNHIFENLSGKLLIASPYQMQDTIFHQAIIYVVSHEKDISIGFILNRLVHKFPATSLLNLLSEEAKQDKKLESSTEVPITEVPIYIGGPVALDSMSFLHSDEYFKNTLFPVNNHLSVSNDKTVLKDILLDQGPKNHLVFVGHTIWRPGELETELENHLWIAANFDHELVFSCPPEEKWSLALQKFGIDDANFSLEIGQC